MNQLELEFYDLGPVWHLCTPGEHQCVIFRTSEEYVYGMNLIAQAAINFHDKLKILTFQIMSNHFHFVLACEECILKEFYDFIYKKLHRFLAGYNRSSDIKGMSCSYFCIDTLRYLQTVIAYVNRNGYLIDSNSTPFSYEWGACNYFFNPLIECVSTEPLSKIGKNRMREAFKSRSFQLTKEYNFLTQRGYVSPASFCAISLAEGLYQDPRHYFHLISRQVESYTQIAKELGDSVIYTDSEIYSAIIGLSLKQYNVKNLTQLGKNEKLELAKLMHYNYNASNKQIKRVLKLDDSILAQLSPQGPQKSKK